MDLDEAVTELYGLAQDAFLDGRSRLVAAAKAERDTGLAKAIASVRKPTAAAWAVNQLVRQRPEEVERLLGLATALHEAQDAMDGPALKSLGRQRTTLVDELVRATADVAQEVGGSALGAGGGSGARDLRRGAGIDPGGRGRRVRTADPGPVVCRVRRRRPVGGHGRALPRPATGPAGHRRRW